MEPEQVQKRLHCAIQEVAGRDRHLLEHDLGERCIASRLAMYLQKVFPEYSVDVEYNRAGDVPKKLGLPQRCANYEDEDGRAIVVPDIIVHARGPEGPNILVLELKKTTNRDRGECDRLRLRAFRTELHYQCGALILCETRRGRESGVTIAEWLEG